MSIKVESVETVYSDGKHNAFTSITKHQGMYYLAFRSGDDHLSPEAAITIMVSADGKAWTVLTRLAGATGEDFRDPEIISFNGKLIVYFAVRYQGREDRDSVAYFSEDGENFTAATLNGLKHGYWLWGMVERNGELFGTAYLHSDGDDFLKLYRSSDGFIWENVYDFPEKCNETALDVGDDGKLYALARTETKPFKPYLFIFDDVEAGPIESFILDTVLHGPMLKRLKNGCLMIGRHWDKEDRSDERVDLIWRGDDGSLDYVDTLPSGGDCSYASWIEVSDGGALVSYYSGHHRPAGASSQCDIFVAHISY